jgi:HCOMODA/2-hydroxy-3-carboxy-muconic semialdehyde decarboxylase
MAMFDVEAAIRDLVIANRILAHEGVVDAYGHISVRHPEDPNRYFLSCSRSPELVTRADIMEFALDGRALNGDERTPYVERHIHGGIYESRPEIMSVVHSHAEDVLPFGIAPVPLRPVIHSGGFMGHRAPIWDIREKFGDTNLLVVNMDQGRDLARTLGEARVTLMRGHGFAAAGRAIPDVVRLSVYLPKNARVLEKALRMGGARELSSGEIDKRLAISPTGPETQRAWEYWAPRAGCGELLRAPSKRRAPARKKPAARAKRARRR